MGENAITLPASLMERIKQRIEGTDFTSVADYVTYVLGEVLAEEEETCDAASSREDEERVKERLRSLGYLD